jgi:hypothetical protein
MERPRLAYAAFLRDRLDLPQGAREPWIERRPGTAPIQP